MPTYAADLKVQINCNTYVYAAKKTKEGLKMVKTKRLEEPVYFVMKKMIIGTLDIDQLNEKFLPKAYVDLNYTTLRRAEAIENKEVKIVAIENVSDELGLVKSWEL